MLIKINITFDDSVIHKDELTTISNIKKKPCWKGQVTFEKVTKIDTTMPIKILELSIMAHTT